MTDASEDLTKMRASSPHQSPNAPSSSSSSSVFNSSSSSEEGGETPREDKSPSRMSGSYHEIFESKPSHNVDPSSESPRGAGECYYNSPESGLLHFCTDGNTVKTTEYLTSKLVQDSLKYKDNHAAESLSTPPEFTPLDPEALADMERHSRRLASSIDSLIEHLSDTLHNTSDITVKSIEVYKDAVCQTCDEVDTNIKCMYQLMAKVEELNKAMTPAYRLAEQIKDMKKLLDMFENAYSIR